MNYSEILEALREFTTRERIDLRQLALGAKPVSGYEPIHKYVLDLTKPAKPETAAEDLFTALCQDVLRIQPTRQVGSGEGWVDFMLPERMGEPLPLELKPLFQRDGPDALWRSDANPKQHVAQVKKYLRDHEYLILTDLRTAWFFSARDFYFENKPFAELPFIDFFGRCRETGSVLDTLRRVEDTAEKPELEQQFFEDLKIWFNEFDKVKWTPVEQTAESIILLINKLIFARTIEDFGLVPYRFTQDGDGKCRRDAGAPRGKTETDAAARASLPTKRTWVTPMVGFWFLFQALNVRRMLRAFSKQTVAIRESMKEEAVFLGSSFHLHQAHGGQVVSAPSLKICHRDTSVSAKATTRQGGRRDEIRLYE